MSNLKKFITNGKILILTCLVIVSFFFSSIGWRHVDSTESGRVIVAALILVIIYTLIVFELINRNLAALIGAAMSVAAYDCLVEFVTMEELLGWLDLETLSLLFGMMIIVNVLSGSGLFDFLAIWSYKQSRGHFWLLMTIMSIIAATLSALVDNVSTMLLLSPTLIRLSEFEHIDPRYVLMIMVIICNIGGCATPVGDPPNLIIIGNDIVSSIQVNFGSFTYYCAPGVILTIICALAYLRLRYKSKEGFRCSGHVEDFETHTTEEDKSIRSGDLVEELRMLELFSSKLNSHSQPLSEETEQLRCWLEERTDQLRCEAQSIDQLEMFGKSSGRRVSSRLDDQEIERLTQTHCIKDHRTLYESLAVLCVAILLFFLQSIPAFNLTLGWVSLFAGLTLLLLNSRKGEQSFEQIIVKIEWTTLMFFFALFITMEAMAKLGLIGFMGKQITQLIDCLPEGQVRDMGAITIVLWTSGLASACIDNVPFTSMMIKILATMIDAKAGAARAASMAPSSLRSLVFALAFGACYGGNGTLIGASANLVTAGVASRLGYPITFNGFFKFAAPITLLSLLVANLYLIVVFVWLGL